ncbi:MAG: hypothetical protein LBV79_06210, partial [Candidatus Adiutrix sp.]|nr:hypothetical protein [Candidatus Adiutrix sp.]
AHGTLSLVDDIGQLRERIRFYNGDLGELAEPIDLRPGDGYELRGDEWWKVRFSKLAFRSRFTLSEKVAIKTAIAAGNFVTASIYDDLMVADFIDVTDPSTIQALGALASDVGGQVVTPERAAEILAGEKYVGES